MLKVTSPQVPGLFFKVECGTCCNKSNKSRAVLQATAAKSPSLPLARSVFFDAIMGLAGASPASPAPHVSELPRPPECSPCSKSLRVPAHLPARDAPTSDRKERSAPQAEALGLRPQRVQRIVSWATRTEGREGWASCGFLDMPTGLIAQLERANG